MRGALVVCAGIWVLLICSIHMLATAAAPDVEVCMDADIREQARGLMFDGIDAALRNRIAALFEVWMKDDTDQPERAVRGMKNGLVAYAGARRAVVEWNPPVCKGDKQ